MQRCSDHLSKLDTCPVCQNELFNGQSSVANHSLLDYSSFYTCFTSSVQKTLKIGTLLRYQLNGYYCIVGSELHYIDWQAAALACQPIANRPPRDVRLRKNLWIIGLMVKHCHKHV